MDLSRPNKVAAAYWTAWRSSGDFTESEAWSAVDDAVSSGDPAAITVFDAM